MQLGARYQDVICAPGILWIDAERVVRGDELGISRAHYAVRAGITVAPGPLLAHDLDERRLFRDSDELRPYEQARCQHRSDSERGHHGQPPLELFVLRCVRRALPLAVAVAKDR